MYRIYKLSHYLGTRLVKTVVILARYSVYTNQYDFIEKIVTIENFIFLRLKSHFCDENHFRRKSHFCDESHFRPFYPFLRRKSQTVSTKVFATKVLAPGKSITEENTLSIVLTAVFFGQVICLDFTLTSQTSDTGKTVLLSLILSNICTGLVSRG